jgi:hypothetical protein
VAGDLCVAVARDVPTAHLLQGKIVSEPSIPATSTRGSFLRAGSVSNSRSLVCYALGIVIGLVLGGISLFNARGTTTNQVPEEDLAVVNQRPVLRSDFLAQLEAEVGPIDQTTREDQLRVLDEMVREELFVQRGLELDFAETDPDTRYALYNIVEAQILAGVTTGSFSDEQLREYYDSHREELGQKSFEDARDEVQNQLYRSERTRVMSNMLEFLRNRATILVADDYRDDYDPAAFQDSYFP